MRSPQFYMIPFFVGENRIKIICYEAGFYQFILISRRNSYRPWMVIEWDGPPFYFGKGNACIIEVEDPLFLPEKEIKGIMRLPQGNIPVSMVCKPERMV